MHQVFIDGQAGTTGLEIAARLGDRCDVTLLRIADKARKDPAARRAMLNKADLVILCLPDSAAREAVELVTNPDTRILDASTAHRTATQWTYGLPELNPDQRQLIAQSARVSNPGCYASGFILAVRPLLDAGLLHPEPQLTTFAVSGYSGGGRTMIEQYQARERHHALDAPRAYALDMHHKHLPEMQHFAGLDTPPLFTPMVADYYKGMVVYVPLTPAQLADGATAADLHKLLAQRYENEPCVRVAPLGASEQLQNGSLSPTTANDTNRVDLMVFGDDHQTLLAARLDNLGKGAAGAAVQNLNLMLGVAELTGLALT